MSAEEENLEQKCQCCSRSGEELEFWETGNLYKQIAPSTPINLMICHKCSPLSSLCKICHQRYPAHFAIGLTTYLKPIETFIDDRGYFYEVCLDCLRKSTDYFCCPICDTWRKSKDRDEENPKFCYRCIDRKYDASCEILPYTTNPLEYLTFQGKSTDKIYYGLELELQQDDLGLGRSAYQLNQLLKNFGILKADDSIEPGVEIVSAPATLEIHRKKWLEILSKLPKRLEATKKCGFHVHVSRFGLSQLTIGKILVFVNNPDNRTQIVKIAGRKSEDYAYFSDDKKITDCLLKKRFCSHYEAINIRNAQTIEFRIFASTTDYTELMMRLDFTAATIAFCQTTSLKNLDWADFINWLLDYHKQYKFLFRFLEEEKLAQLRKVANLRKAK